MMYSAYKLNKQGDNIQPWCTPYPIWNQSVVPCPVLTVASWPAYRFLKRQIRWSEIPVSQNFPQFIVIYTVKGFVIVHKAEIDVYSDFGALQNKVCHCFHCFSIYLPWSDGMGCHDLGTLLFFRWSSGCWQFDLWFLCLFLKPSYNDLKFTVQNSNYNCTKLI